MTGVEEPRAAARALAIAAQEAGEPLRWFEELYAAADRGEAAVPWADLHPNVALVRELPALAVEGKRALVVGCGYGDDAALLAGAGAHVTAFDVAPSAVEHARQRFPKLPITWAVADATALDPAWSRAFDLVVEIFTLQVLPPPERATALAELVGCLAPGGRLFVYCRGREPEDPAGEAFPFPLTVAELRDAARDGVEVERFDDLFDEEDPPVRRFLVLLRRSA